MEEASLGLKNCLNVNLAHLVATQLTMVDLDSLLGTRGGSGRALGTELGFPKVTALAKEPSKAHSTWLVGAGLATLGNIIVDGACCKWLVALLCLLPAGPPRIPLLRPPWLPTVADPPEGFTTPAAPGRSECRLRTDPAVNRNCTAPLTSTAVVLESTFAGGTPAEEDWQWPVLLLVA